MPQVPFGGSSSGGSYSGSGHLWSDGIGLPVGRVMRTGSRAVLISALQGYVAGRGGPRTVQLQLGSAITGQFGVGAASDAVATGLHSVSPWLVEGGVATFHVHFSGGFLYFGKGGGGHTNHGSGSGWAGTLGGSYYYVQAPTAPHSLTLASDSPDSVTASWAAPVDNGDAGITGYLLQYSLDQNFASGVVSIENGPSTVAAISDLEAGETYYFRVFARNAVTTAANTTSVASATASIDIASTGTVIAGIPPNFTENPGAFWSLSGHNVGFNKEGNMVKLDEAAVSFEYYDPSTTSYETTTVVVRRNAAWSVDFSVIGEKMYANNVQGDSLVGLVSSDGDSSTQMIAFKTVLDNGPMELSWRGGPEDSSMGTGQFVVLSLDKTSELLEISATYRSAGVLVESTDTASVSSLDLDSELAVYLTYSWNEDTRTYSLYASVRPSNSYTSSISVSLSYVADGLDLYTQPWQLLGMVRSLVTANLLAGAPITDLQEWENEPSYHPQSGLNTGGPVTGYEGNVWDYLQMAAAATHCEYSVIDGVVTVMPIGSRVLDVTNMVGAPTLSPQSMFTGRAVEIAYSNAKPVNLGTIYDAGIEGNRTFSVPKNETRVESVITSASAQTVLQPSPTGIYPNPTGTYYVIDSNGEPVSPIDWVENGGSVLVAVNASRADVIDITLTGPIIEIPGSPGPYTVGAKSGTIMLGTLRLVGSGLSTDRDTLTLLTGADPEKTPQEVATSIENVFISDVQMAYDRGIWASAEATHRITLSGTLPLSAVEHFGLVQGSLVRYNDNIFRITDATVTNIDVEFSADVFCLVSDFDARWVDQTVAQHDLHWLGYEAQDERIIPLR